MAGRALLDSPDANGAPNNIGTGHYIGDNVILTAGHVVYEFNEDNTIANRAIITLPSVTPILSLDIRQYQSSYITQYQSLSDPLPSPSGGQSISGQFVESQILSKDIQFISGSGKVSSRDDGIVVYINQTDLLSANFGLNSGTTLSRYGRTSGSTSGLATQITSGGFIFDQVSQGGDSGGAFTLTYAGHDYIVGNVISTNISASTTRGSLFTKAEFDTINSYLAGQGQNGDVTRKEPGNLIIGSSSGENIAGSFRADKILGGAGADTIDDGDTPVSTVWANDTLIGGANDDTFIVGKGDDIVWGGDEGSDVPASNDHVDYSAATAPITISLTGTSTDVSISVSGAQTGIDTLHSIEKITGTSGRDMLDLSGTLPSGYSLTVDGGNNSPGFGDIVKASTAFTVNITSGSGTITSGGGQINVQNFHTQFFGSNEDDTIFDDSDGEKKALGGGGNDEISVAGSSGNAIIFGGDGDDTLIGGEGNDIIVADKMNQMYGYQNIISSGDGSDYILTKSPVDEINAGAGDDYIKSYLETSLTGYPSMGFINGGAGNDVIEIVGSFGINVVLADGGGNDTVVADEWPTGPLGSANVNVILDGVNPSDITLIWDATPNSSGNFTGTADLVIVSDVTGDSILIPNISGYLSLDGNTNHSSDYVRLHLSINGQSAYYDNGISYDFGSVDQYRTDLTNFSANTMPDTADLTGTSGNDALRGGAGDDEISGGAGDDIFEGLLGNDTVDGGDGYDTLYLFGGRGAYQITNVGDDVVVEDAGGIDGAITVTMSSVESIYFIGDATEYKIGDFFGYYGTTSADVLIGSDFNNQMYGNLGGDVMVALAGYDQIFGDAGNDDIDGGAGNDEIHGGDGDDDLRGGSGYDWIDGGDGVDTVHFGGVASDYQIHNSFGYLWVNAINEFADSGAATVYNAEFVSFDDEDDPRTLEDQHLYGTSSNDTIIGDFGNDTIEGMDGDDTVRGGVGQDNIDGGDGSDTALYGGISSRYRVARQIDGTISVSDWYFESNDETDYLQNVEAMYFAGDDVTLTLNDIPDLGTSGNDLIIGSSRLDQLFGLAGDDQISGADGDDELDGGEGADTMIGGAGNDYYLVDNVGDLILEEEDEGYDAVDSTVSYTINDNIEDLYLSGEDPINGTGNALDNYISGNDAANALSGGAGSDHLDAYSGNDSLTGGLGDDFLYGGDGNDTSIFAGHSSDYTVSTSGGEIQIVDDAPTVSGDDGTDTIYEVEHAQFSDQTINLSSPIILDLDGNGVNLVDVKRSKARFDFDGDGKRDRTGWVGRGDGLLVFDRNGDGTVSDVSELSFIGDKAHARSDLDGLSAFDSNGDGLFSALDDRFSEFSIWRDRDQDGKVDKREMVSLNQVGIAAINLAGQATERDWAWGSNIVVNEGSFIRTDGSSGALADVALNYQASSLNAGVQRSRMFARQLIEASAAFGVQSAGSVFGAEQNDDRGHGFLALAHHRLER